MIDALVGGRKASHAPPSVPTIGGQRRPTRGWGGGGSGASAGDSQRKFKQTFSTSSSKAHWTPSRVFALASMNSMQCLRANFNPSSLLTSRFSCNRHSGFQSRHLLCIHLHLQSFRNRMERVRSDLTFALEFIRFKKHLKLISNYKHTRARSRIV